MSLTAEPRNGVRDGVPAQTGRRRLTLPTLPTRGLLRSMGARLQPVDSPNFRDGAFRNRLPAAVVEAGSQGSMAVEWAARKLRRNPLGPIPLVRPDLPAQAADLAATWLGHTTTLLEVGGHWLLTDPVWSERCSPSPTIGPKRAHPVPLALTDLPRLSAVLISHDHYDHLDTATIDALTALQDVPYVVPLGIGQHLRHWGVPEHRIVELDWGQSHALRHPGLGDLTLVCTEARHFSGRGLTGNNRTLWSSWVATAGERRVFFGGDTGYTPAFADVGAAYGPFDLTVIPVGAYDRRWPDVHVDPAEAVQMHRDVRGDVMLPVHWATFDLAFHDWSAPVAWARAEAAERGVTLATPRIGERFVPAERVPTDDWWSSLGG